MLTSIFLIHLLAHNLLLRLADGGENIWLAFVVT
jgi:hypothetical protein